MISILIRNKNEAKSLDKTLKSIHNQNFNVPFEIVVIDDNSIDNSVDVAKHYGCKVISLDRKFTYGYALNFGIKHCQYEIIFLISSHNLLISNDFSEKLIKYFDDPKVAGVRCTPIANIKQLEQSLDSSIILDVNNYVHSNHWQNLLVANCSALRKSLALDVLFNETIRSNEEKLWCLDIMKKGYCIISNTPCYFLYNKKNHSSALIRDVTSKYQIDGTIPKSVGSFILILFKSLPWAFKIASTTWYNNIKVHALTVLIPFKHQKGIYK
jgi:glycosyltransferase involved in cell wall biosynthesis